MYDSIRKAFIDEIQSIVKQAQPLPGAEQAMRTMASKGKDIALGNKLPEAVREFIKKHPIASGAIGGYSLSSLLKKDKEE